MTKDINDRSINPLIRIADALDKIVSYMEADQEATKRITEKWDNDLDEKEVVKKDKNFNYDQSENVYQLNFPFPEVE